MNFFANDYVCNGFLMIYSFDSFEFVVSLGVVHSLHINQALTFVELAVNLSV